MDSKGMSGIPCSLDPVMRRDDNKHSMVYHQKKRSKVNIEKLLQSDRGSLFEGQETMTK